MMELLQAANHIQKKDLLWLFSTVLNMHLKWILTYSTQKDVHIYIYIRFSEQNLVLESFNSILAVFWSLE